MTSKYIETQCPDDRKIQLDVSYSVTAPKTTIQENKKQITNAGQDVKAEKPLTHCWGDVNYNSFTEHTKEDAS